MLQTMGPGLSAGAASTQPKANNENAGVSDYMQRFDTDVNDAAVRRSMTSTTP